MDKKNCHKKIQIGLEGSKSPKNGPKVRFLGFWQYAFLLQYKNSNSFSTFWEKKNMFGKNLVLELLSKNLKNNQNAGFFKLQYLTNNFFTAIWLPHSQLWTIIKGTASPTQDQWESHKKVGSLSTAERLVRFEAEPSDSDYNALTH